MKCSISLELTTRLASFSGPYNHAKKIPTFAGIFFARYSNLYGLKTNAKAPVQSTPFG